VSDFRGRATDYAFFIDAAYYTNDIKLSYLNPSAEICVISTPTKETTFFSDVIKNNNFNHVNLDWFENPAFTTGLTWMKLNFLGEIITKKEHTFTKVDMDEKISLGYIPVSPWMLKFLPLTDR
jgi:hypothetical protein